MGMMDMVAGWFGSGTKDSRYDGRMAKELGRNEQCWCGSGQKYKRCCLPQDEKKLRAASAASCSGST